MIYRKKKNLFKRWDYWLGVIVFLIMIIPWSINSITYYGSPFGALSTASGTVDETWFNYPPYFYFTNWVNIFGFVGLFALPGFYILLRRRKKYDISLLIVILAALTFFMFIVARKEERYLLHYFSFLSGNLKSG